MKTTNLLIFIVASFIVGALGAVVLTQQTYQKETPLKNETYTSNTSKEKDLNEESKEVLPSDYNTKTKKEESTSIKTTVEPTRQENQQNTQTPTQQEQVFNVKVIYVDLMTDINPNNIEFKEKTNRKDVLTFAIERLINGYSNHPNEFVKNGFKNNLTGISNCNGKDFKASVSNGNAKIQFCRTFVGVGTMYDASVLESIKKTAKQFSTVNKVTILDVDGNCLFDNSGMNLCLNNT